MCRRELVLIRARVHPFPSRTRKLSSLLLTILGWRRPGKIGSANTKPLRRKSRGFCRVTENRVELRRTARSYGEAQGIAGGSGCLRHHPVTGQLSALLLTILGWRRPGKIASANTKPLRRKSWGFFRVTENCVESWRDAGSSGGVIRGEQSCFGRLPGEVWKNQRKIMTAYRLGFLENMSVIRKKFFSKYGGYGILTTIGMSAGRPRSAAVFSAENGNADGGRTKEGCERAWANCCVWSISASGSEISMPTRTSA